MRDEVQDRQQREVGGEAAHEDVMGEVGESTPTDTAQAQQEQVQTEPLDEVEVLRSELEGARAEVADFKNRFLRARADLENYRRRAAQDTARAREAGLDSAIVTVLSVYDDLGRALSVAGDDPSQLIPGLEAVREGLKRNLETLGITEIGSKGEPFNPDLHEALTAVPTADEAAAGTIAEVIQTGFVKEERLVRPARVVVFQG